MLALHFDNLLFLLLVGMAGLLRLLASKAGEAKRKSGTPEQRPAPAPPPITRAPVESDEERIRKFLEALGQPVTAKPPPPVAARPTYEKPIVLQHLPPFSSPLPPLTTKPPELPRRVILPRQAGKLPNEKKVLQPQVAAPPVFEVQKGTARTEPVPVIKTPSEAYAIAAEQIVQGEKAKIDIAVLLASTSGLRNAIILREIFGPPRSLQPFDLVGSA